MCARSGPWKKLAGFVWDQGPTGVAETALSTKSLLQPSRKKDVPERAIGERAFQRAVGQPQRFSSTAYRARRRLRPDRLDEMNLTPCCRHRIGGVRVEAQDPRKDQRVRRLQRWGSTGTVPEPAA